MMLEQTLTLGACAVFLVRATRRRAARRTVAAERTAA
jgi:hypothetical protein